MHKSFQRYRRPQETENKHAKAGVSIKDTWNHCWAARFNSLCRSDYARRPGSTTCAGDQPRHGCVHATSVFRHPAGRRLRPAATDRSLGGQAGFGAGDLIVMKLVFGALFGFAGMALATPLAAGLAVWRCWWKCFTLRMC
jgi:hypothetical protein